MTKEQPTDRPLGRRTMLRGGAVLAGAAGATVIGAALGPATAEAANGDAVKLGQNNSATLTTKLSVTSNTEPTLSLSNEFGPGLHLNVLANNYSGELVPGDIVATKLGPLVGVDYAGPETTNLATGKDLDFLYLPTAQTPTRVLDTRPGKSPGLVNILRKSSDSAVDGQGHLTAGSYIDVGVSSTAGGALLSAAFLNVTVIDPAGNGYLTVYPPGTRPDASNINFRTLVNLSNAAFVGLGEVVGESYVVRIFSSQTTHLLLDVSGAVMALDPYGTAGAAAQSTAARRAARRDKRAALLRKNLAQLG